MKTTTIYALMWYLEHIFEQITFYETSIIQKWATGIWKNRPIFFSYGLSLGGFDTGYPTKARAQLLCLENICKRLMRSPTKGFSHS